MRVHFIAIGGAVNYDLAIALHKKGYAVTGSDEEIFDPSKSRLEKYGLLPEACGWFPESVTKDIETVIFGMHTKADNPELLKARDLGLKIMSFPEYLYEQTKDKRRIVIAGSHGKTMTTAIIMHVFRKLKIDFDYVTGSQIDGFDTMVGLSLTSKMAVFEGDLYLTSAIDKRPRAHLYMPDIAVLNGIAWDHMNVFPTFTDYLEQFRIFVNKIVPGGTLIYFDGDDEVRKIAKGSPDSIKKVAYKVHGYFQNKTGFYAATHNRVVAVKIFGEHNMQNLAAAREACYAAGINEDDFYAAVQSFEGISRRLQKMKETANGLIYLDIAQSPSKVKATVEAVVARYPGRKIIACLELNTLSSLNSEFLPLYDKTLEKAAPAFVYFNPHAIELKKLPNLSIEAVSKAFGGDNVTVYNDSCKMFDFIRSQNYSCPVYLFMSSGNFDGFDLNSLIE
jgi:UDP-N-acetylmuramate: L-alanyl-gamma-D-glutamyl-meso-diaminopimelate ligase